MHGQPVSSSCIRQLLQKGAVTEAASLLGYPYTVGGKVVEGRREARRLGTPTANLPWPEEKVRLPAGIYVGWAEIETMHFRPVAQGLPALLYIPPVGALEVHLLTERQDLYDKTLRVSFLRQLRPHRLFSDEEALRAQVEADVAEARKYFGL
jgi:riboflavin kinase/FMN adenylyltransferase